jgi:hypothetical protein
VALFRPYGSEEKRKEERRNYAEFHALLCPLNLVSRSCFFTTLIAYTDIIY